jgi:hypothetical protein
LATISPPAVISGDAPSSLTWCHAARYNARASLMHSRHLPRLASLFSGKAAACAAMARESRLGRRGESIALRRGRKWQVIAVAAHSTPRDLCNDQFIRPNQKSIFGCSRAYNCQFCFLDLGGSDGERPRATLLLPRFFYVALSMWWRKEAAMPPSLPSSATRELKCFCSQWPPHC